MPTLQPNDQPTFEREKARIKEKSPQADFDKLRTSYTRTAQYQPWESREHEAGLLLLEAYEDGDFSFCLRLADAVLELNFTSLLAHFGSAACHSGLGNEQQSRFHAWVLQGLINSIQSSGDGKSSATPFVCNSPTEMRDFIRMLSLLMYRQEYVSTAPRQIEKIHTLDIDSDRNVVLYFDTTAARMHSFKMRGSP